MRTCWQRRWTPLPAMPAGVRGEADIGTERRRRELNATFHLPALAGVEARVFAHHGVVITPPTTGPLMPSVAGMNDRPEVFFALTAE